MSDDFSLLRTRIADAIEGELDHLVPRIDIELAADAVIRELGLVEEDGECSYCHAQLPGCRYVTEWSDRQPRSAEKLGLVGDGE